MNWLRGVGARLKGVTAHRESIVPSTSRPELPAPSADANSTALFTTASGSAFGQAEAAAAAAAAPAAAFSVARADPGSAGSAGEEGCR